jgi:hypothetical protein
MSQVAVTSCSGSDRTDNMTAFGLLLLVECDRNKMKILRLRSEPLCGRLHSCLLMPARFSVMECHEYSYAYGVS